MAYQQQAADDAQHTTFGQFTHNLLGENGIPAALSAIVWPSPPTVGPGPSSSLVSARVPNHEAAQGLSSVHRAPA